MLKTWTLILAASSAMAMVHPSGKGSYSSRRTGMIREQEGSSNNSNSSSGDKYNSSSPSYHPTDMQILADNDTGELLIITTQYGPRRESSSRYQQQPIGAEGWWDDWFGKGRKRPDEDEEDRKAPRPQPRLPLLSALRYEGSRKWPSVNDDHPTAYFSSPSSSSPSSSKSSRSGSSSDSPRSSPFGQSFYSYKSSSKSPSFGPSNSSSKAKDKLFTAETAAAFGAGAFAMAFLITLGALVKMAFFEEDSTGYRGYSRVPSYDEAVPYSLASKKVSGKQEKCSSKKKSSPSSSSDSNSSNNSSSSSNAIPLGWYNQV